MQVAPSVLLAAGGTGGHLFPAFALAEELTRRNVLVDLITDLRGDRYGTGFPARTVYRVPAATLAGKSPVAALKTAIALARGTKAAHAILGQARPLVVAGFGGYPTCPPLIAAGLRKIPVLVHEQNAVLGRANKMLAKRATAIATSFATTKFLDGGLASKATMTGNPVRASVLNAASRAYDAPHPLGDFRLLVFGGSQGARYFSDTIPPALAALPAGVRRRLRVTHQAREEDLVRVRESYAAAGIAANAEAFFKDLPELMAESHLVICRAGASTIAELAVIGRPAIMVPLPHALDNDQLNNARGLADAGGGWAIEQKNLNPAVWTAEIARLAAAPELLISAAAAAKRSGRPDAVHRLAELVLTLASSQSHKPQ